MPPFLRGTQGLEQASPNAVPRTIMRESSSSAHFAGMGSSLRIVDFPAPPAESAVMINSTALPRQRPGRDFIARHGETVFNAARRLQGDAAHTPLTQAGFAQAQEMGRALADYLGPRPALTLWASPTGRALQTLAVIAEHLGNDWHRVRTDPRLVEIGMGKWGGSYYADLAGDGPILDPSTGLFRTRAPEGEWYDEIAERVSAWLSDTNDDSGDRLIIMHGMSSRVLRGVMTGGQLLADYGAPIADQLPQGSVVMIENGVETVIHRGSGHAPA